MKQQKHKKEKKKEQKAEELPLIDKVYHRGITYYDRIIEKFETIGDNGKKRKVLNADLEPKQVIVEEERTDIPEDMQGDVEEEIDKSLLDVVLNDVVNDENVYVRKYLVD